MLDIGESPNTTDVYGRRAIWHASSNGHIEIVKLLIKKGAEPDYNIDLAGAAQNGHIKTVKFLLNTGGITSVHMARIDVKLHRKILPIYGRILQLLNEKFHYSSSDSEESDQPRMTRSVRRANNKVKARKQAKEQVQEVVEKEYEPMTITAGMRKIGGQRRGMIPNTQTFTDLERAKQFILNGPTQGEYKIDNKVFESKADALEFINRM